MTCAECELAVRRPFHGVYLANCPTCEIRAVSVSPKFVRQRYYEQKAPADRAAFIEAVQAELQRRHDVMATK